MLQCTFCYPWNFLLEVVREIVMWRHECMQDTIRQKRGKLVIYLAVISSFLGKSKHIFSLCLCLCFSYPHSTEGKKVGSKTLLGFDTNLIGQRETNFRCVLSSTLYKVLTRNFQSDSFFLWDAYGWKTTETQVSESDWNLGMKTFPKPSNGLRRLLVTKPKGPGGSEQNNQVFLSGSEERETHPLQGINVNHGAC